MLIGYKKEFAAKVMDGSKCITFRRTPKRFPQLGEAAYEYTGLRTKNCQKLRDDRIVAFAAPVKIAEDMLCILRGDYWQGILEPDRLQEHAQRDGFDSWADLYAWHKANGNADDDASMIVIALKVKEGGTHA